MTSMALCLSGSLILFSGCQDPIIEEESGGTTVIYQTGDNKKGIDLDTHSGPLPSGSVKVYFESVVKNNDASQGVDLVLVVDNSHSMVTQGTRVKAGHRVGDMEAYYNGNSSELRGKIRQRYGNGYFYYDNTGKGYWGKQEGNPKYIHSSAHKLDEVFDVLAEQDDIDLNVTLVTAASDQYGFFRNNKSQDKLNHNHFSYRRISSNWSKNLIPGLCVPPINMAWTSQSDKAFYRSNNNGGYYFNTYRYDSWLSLRKLPHQYQSIDYHDNYFDRPGNIYHKSLIGPGGHFNSRLPDGKFNHINCVVESFSSLLVLDHLIDPSKEIKDNLENFSGRNKVFRNEKTLKIFVVISDSFAPGHDDIANPVRAVLKHTVKNSFWQGKRGKKKGDTEARFKEQAKAAFGRENVRFYSFSTRGNENLGKFAVDDPGYELTRQTSQSGKKPTSSTLEPIDCGRYYGRGYERIAKFFQGEQFDICSHSWGSHLRSMFKFQKSDSPVSVRESYEIRQLQGKVFDVTLVKLGERT
ncbi:MAG: hypothetical protein OXC40_02395, partial [Proteobacteria bacterium]|nr:hypothetical protein [Pseudomonadota bacterium]